jgi:hypothetical protein
LPPHQTLHVWLISGCAFGTNAVQLRIELFHRLNATSANGRMPGVLANVRFPMPAVLAFLAVGVIRFQAVNFMTDLRAEL